MKKVFVSLLLAIVFGTPVFAGNLLQQEFEKDIEFELNYSADFLIDNDYEGFLQGKDSVYGLILNIIEKTNNSLDIKYANKIKRDYDCFRKYKNTGSCNLTQIKIEDSEYKSLNKELKGLIGAFNFMFDI